MTPEPTEEQKPEPDASGQVLCTQPEEKKKKPRVGRWVRQLVGKHGQITTDSYGRQYVTIGRTLYRREQLKP